MSNAARFTGAGRPRAFGPSLLLGAGLALLSAGARPAVAEDAWVAARSPNFLVVSNGGERAARDVARQFELVRSLFGSLFRARVDPGCPFIVVAVRDEKSMKALAPWYWEHKGGRIPAGLFAGRSDKQYVLLRLDAGVDESPYHVLFHEFTHLVTFLNFVTLPLWVNEGLAEFFATASVDDREVRWGHVLPWHVHRLRGEKLIALPELLAADHDSPLYNERGRVSIFYAQSAILIHYLLLGSPERQGQFSTYTTLLAEGVAGPEAFRRAFGDTKLLERELAAYVRQFQFFGRKAPAKLNAQEVTVRPLSAAEVAALSADFLVRSGRTREARRLLERAVAEAPDLAAAQETLGLLEAREGHHEAAAGHLTRAVELLPQNYIALYHGATLGGPPRAADDVERRERDLRRVVELNPQFSPGHAALARILLEREGRPEEAVAAARRACALAPGAVGYRLILKRALARAGNTQEVARVDAALLKAALGQPGALAVVVHDYQEAARHDEAEELLKRAMQADPRRLSVLLQLAAFLQGRQRFVEAEAVLRDALRFRPNSPVLENNLAYVLADGLGKGEEALKLVRRALEREPMNPSFLDTQGWALYKLRRFEEAEKALRDALEQTDDSTIREHLGDVLLARGDRVGARDQWQRALSLADLQEDRRSAIEAKIRSVDGGPAQPSAG